MAKSTFTKPDVFIIESLDPDDEGNGRFEGSIISNMLRLHASLANMSDYMDTDIVPFEELAADEQNICCLVANISCGIAYLVLSLV